MSVIKWIGGTTNSANSLAVASNFAPASVPISGDDLYIEASTGSDYSITAGLTTLAAVVLNSLNVSQTYTGQIGLNATSSAYMQVGATTTNIGYQYGGTVPGSGSSLIRIDNGTSQNTTNIFNTASSSALGNGGPVTLLGSHTANILNVISGVFSVAQDPSESAVYATVNTGGTAFFGTGVTLTTVNVINGSCTVRSAATTINVTNGGLITAGAGAITTLNANGGSAILNATGTITNLNTYAATVDMSQSPASRTVTNLTIYNGGDFNFNNGVKGSIAFTNGAVIKASAGQYRITPWPNTNLAFS